MDQTIVRPPNRFLQALGSSDFNLLSSHLRTVTLRQDTTLFAPGRPIDRLYFPHTALISMVISLECGGSVETGMVGRDSVAGAPAAFDLPLSFSGAVVQIGGEASVVDVATIQTAVKSSDSLRSALYRHDQLLLAQAQQSVGCASKHQVGERLSRWLLHIRDLVHSDTIALTQESLAQMMGVRRTSVTLVAHSLQNAGLIKYRRGKIRIVDLEGLQQASCECHAAVQSHEANIFGH